MNSNNKWSICIVKAVKVLLNCPANTAYLKVLSTNRLRFFHLLKTPGAWYSTAIWGSQYTSDIFENYLNSKVIKHSFTRKGNPYDNACIESFHSLLKKEMIYCKEYHSFEEAQSDIFEYIESWYNRKHRHTFLD